MNGSGWYRELHGRRAAQEGEEPEKTTKEKDLQPLFSSQSSPRFTDSHVTLRKTSPAAIPCGAPPCLVLPFQQSSVVSK